jgi:hypothetical protein
MTSEKDKLLRVHEEMGGGGLKITLFWRVALYGLVDLYRRFGGTSANIYIYQKTIIFRVTAVRISQLEVG